MLCDDRLFDLMTVLGNLNARVSGVSTCVSTQTTAPVLTRALNDIVPRPQKEAIPVIMLAHMEAGDTVVPHEIIEHQSVSGSSLTYQRVGALIGHVLPEREGGLPVVVEPPVTLPPSSTNVVVKWPDERRVEEHAHPLADHLRLRDLDASSQ